MVAQSDVDVIASSCCLRIHFVSFFFLITKSQKFIFFFFHNFYWQLGYYAYYSNSGHDGGKLFSETLWISVS